MELEHMIIIIFSFILIFSVSMWFALPKIALYLKNKKINSLLKNKEYKVLFREHNISKRVEMTDQELLYFTKLFNQEKTLTKTCSVVSNYRTSIHYNNRSIYNGRELNFNSLNVVIQKIGFPDNNIVFLISTESHYGQPVWSGKRMSYPYHISHNTYFSELKDTTDIYYKIMNTLFSVVNKEEIPETEKLKEKLHYF
jgi:hypothetical protein